MVRPHVHIPWPLMLLIAPMWLAYITVIGAGMLAAGLWRLVADLLRIRRETGGQPARPGSRRASLYEFAAGFCDGLSKELDRR